MEYSDTNGQFHYKQTNKYKQAEAELSQSQAKR